MSEAQPFRFQAKHKAPRATNGRYRLPSCTPQPQREGWREERPTHRPANTTADFKSHLLGGRQGSTAGGVKLWQTTEAARIYSINTITTLGHLVAEHSDPRKLHVLELGARCRKAMLGVWGARCRKAMLGVWGARCRKAMLGVWDPRTLEMAGTGHALHSLPGTALYYGRLWEMCVWGGGVQTLSACMTFRVQNIYMPKAER